MYGFATSLCWLCLLVVQTQSLSSPGFAQGYLAGEVTADSIILQTRLTASSGYQLNSQGDIEGRAGKVQFEWKTDDSLASEVATGPWHSAEEGNDFIVKQEVRGLLPAQRYAYRCRAKISDTSTGKVDEIVGPWGHFRTLPGSATTNETVNWEFCMGSCMNYYAFQSGKANGNGPVTATREDKELGYPVFKTLAERAPDLFVGTGDIVYYDFPYSNPATTLPELRRKWHEQFRLPRLVKFFRETPAYWSKDDHDFRFDDADLAAKKAPTSQTGKQLFRQQLPVTLFETPNRPTYRTIRVHPDLQLWFLENRDFRSPNRMQDGPEKSIWGSEQKAWLKAGLKQSNATWKLIISPTPMVGPDRASKRDNHTNPQGFLHEGQAFIDWLVEEGLVHQVKILCGDRHWQYHSVHPKGLEEFCCGALNDENSIAGTKPGTKGSTDPDGLIQQPYHYPKPTGGFLSVHLERGTNSRGVLTFTFFDDQGVEGYQKVYSP